MNITIFFENVDQDVKSLLRFIFLNPELDFLINLRILIENHIIEFFLFQ